MRQSTVHEHGRDELPDLEILILWKIQTKPSEHPVLLAGDEMREHEHYGIRDYQSLYPG